MTVGTAEIVYLQELVFSRSGIVLSDDKQYLIESRLHPVARELGLKGITEIVERIRLRRDRALEDRVVEAMTTNETLWFRDIHPFNALRRTVLPELARRHGNTGKISVLSAACSSGQELYSVAMILEDDFPDLRPWRIDLVGIDLSNAMVEKARRGLYSTLETSRGLAASLLVRHFTPEGTGYRLSDAVRRRATFQQGNLAAPWSRHVKYDVIMLRNVLIYFDIATRKRVLTEAAACLDPNGYLFLGSSEALIGISELFVPERADGATYFRLKGRP